MMRASFEDLKWLMWLSMKVQTTIVQTTYSAGPLGYMHMEKETCWSCRLLQRFVAYYYNSITQSEWQIKRKLTAHTAVIYM